MLKASLHLLPELDFLQRSTRVNIMSKACHLKKRLLPLRELDLKSSKEFLILDFIIKITDFDALTSLFCCLTPHLDFWVDRDIYHRNVEVLAAPCKLHFKRR